MYFFVSPKKSEYFKMNRFANELECGSLGFYFIWLCSTRVSDFMVFFRKLIIVKAVFFSDFYNEDYFDSIVIHFNPRIWVSECPVEFHDLWKHLASEDVFIRMYRVCMHIHTLIYFQGCCCLFVSLSSSLNWMQDSSCVCVCVCVCVYVCIVYEYVSPEDVHKVR